MLHRLPLWRWVCKFFNTNTSRMAVHSKEKKEGDTPQGVDTHPDYVTVHEWSNGQTNTIRQIPLKDALEDGMFSKAEKDIFMRKMTTNSEFKDFLHLDESRPYVALVSNPANIVAKKLHQIFKKFN